MASVRVYVKKQVRLERLNFSQRQMFKVGSVGVAAVKNRLAAAQGPTDAPAKPLTKNYAIRKSKWHKGNRRNLYLSGAMLRNFMVRTVSERSARASLTTRKDRIKAWANQKIEQWLVFSPKNRAAVMEAAHRVFREAVKRLATERSLGGNQR